MGSSRQRRAPQRAVAAFALLFFGLIAAASAQQGVDCADGSCSPQSDTQSLPWPVRPGTVVGNAALGVQRATPQILQRQIVSGPLGVQRERAETPRVLSLPSAALGVVRGSVVQAIQPPSVAPGEQEVLVQMLGRGIPANAMPSLEPALDVSIAVDARAADGSSVTLRINVAASAGPGLRRLRLIDAQGLAIPTAGLAAQSLLIAAAAPEIYSIEPMRVAPGDRVELLVRGRHLRALQI